MNPATEIAIIGMSCRFPGAASPQAYWELIANGKNRFQEIPTERTTQFDFSPIRHRRGTFLAEPYHFDYRYFGIARAEALAMDPQQRILLELAVEARNDAGLPTFASPAVGVYVGANQRAYMEAINAGFYRRQALEQLTHLPGFEKIAPTLQQELRNELALIQQMPEIDPSAITGNISNMISARISHELNLFGPSLTVDTACSAALVAVHLACEALQKKDCDLAFAGGVNLNLTPSIFRLMEQAGVISARAECVPFSADSDGILLGEGAGMVLLKRHADAVVDGDRVLALIKGSGMNNDGRSMGIMAPNWKGQLRLLESVYQQAGYDRNQISLIEAHGTSTRIGDSVEITVLEQFFAGHSQPISIGSAKSNLGHLLGASGMAGLIKTVLALQHRQLPPTLFGEQVNPKWKLAEKGFRIQAQLEDWQTTGIRAAGVSAFGFGGTNAHLIVEEAPLADPVQTPVRQPIPTDWQHEKLQYDLFPGLRRQSFWLHTLQWETYVLKTGATDYHPDQWILFADNDVLSLRKELSQTASEALLVQPGETFTRTGERSYQLDYYQADQLRWFFEGLNPAQSYGLLYVPDRVGERATDALLFLKRLLTHAMAFSTMRCWMITRDAFGAIETRAVPGLAASSSPRPLPMGKWETQSQILPRWRGRGGDAENKSGIPAETSAPAHRALATLFSAALNEQPALQGGLIDLGGTDEMLPETILPYLAQVWSQALVLREKEAFQPRLVPINRSTPTEPIDFSPRGVYLILGGSSGIGEQLALHLLDQPVGQVFLTGTRPVGRLSETLQTHLDQSLHYFPVSVSDAAGMQTLVAAIFQQYGRLDGIVYAAGLVHYSSLKTTPEATFQDIVATKIQGIQVLQQAIEDRAVGFVYLLSSVSGLSPAWATGMAAYAAANAYLDAFATAQSGTGTRWLSRSWSIWEGIGMAQQRNLPEGMGLVPLQKETALSLWEQSLTVPASHLALLDPADAATFSFPWRKRSVPVPSPQEPPADPPVAVPSSVPLPRPDFQTVLIALIAQATKLPIAEIDPDESFANLGLDSISALDIVAVLEQKYGLTLNPTLLFEYDTIHLLAEQLGRRSDIPEENSFPLLPTQQSFFFNQTFYPDAPCNILVRLTFPRTFDPGLLQKAWNHLLQGHEALNLRFEMRSEGPVQVRSATGDATLQTLFFRDETAAADLVWEQESRMLYKIYDLEKAPLCDLCYASVGPRRSIWLFGAHHIILDAGSMGLVLQELLARYLQLENEKSLPERTESPDFLDYVRFVQAQLTVQNQDGRRAYWQEALRDFQVVKWPQLTPDRIERAVFQAEIDASLTEKIVAQAQKAPLSLFEWLAAAYYQAVQQTFGQEDVVIRMAMANRDRDFKGSHQIVGCFADSMPLRIQVRGTDTLVELGQKVKAEMKAGAQNRLGTAADYVNLLADRAAADPGGISPFGFSYLNFNRMARRAGSIRPQIETRNSLPFADLSLICLNQPGGLHLSWNYAPATFSAETVQAFHQTFVALLEEEPTASLTTDFPLELPQKTLFPEQGLLHQKVFAACQQFGSRTAIEEGVQRLSYTALKARSVQIANALIRHLPAETAVIGILAYPGIAATAGILGILASGRAYIPLDPAWPATRIADITHHSGLNVLLTTADQLSKVQASPALSASVKTILVLDGEGEDLPMSPFPCLSFQNESSTQLLPNPRPVSPESLAYIMYTSGTTGKPKGVMVTHQAVAIFLSWLSEEFQFSTEDRFILTSSLGFGGSLRQLFSTLLAGGEMHPIDRYDFKDPATLLAFLATRKITLLNTVPSVLQNLCEYVEQTTLPVPDLSALRLLLIGGEILHGQTVLRWGRHFGQQGTIVNLYGSTETIVNATLYRVPWQVKFPGSIPVGRPRKGSHVLLLNEQGEPCRGGEKGELYVGGPSIARGYYRAEDLSRERFVRLTLPGTEGLYYRTGDIAWFDEEGLCQYVGRNDNQIQLYGNRIEPSEIEAVLLTAPAVNKVAVMDFRSDNHHWLAAFIERKPGAEYWTEVEVRDWVAERLPTYMVPRQVEFVMEIPLTHAGKMDRNRLRQEYQPAKSVPESAAEPEEVAALTPTEQSLLEIWQAVLKKEEIGLDEDFFSLGGDSISALGVLHRLRQTFAMVPKPVVLFRQRTLRELAATILELNEGVAESGAKNSGRSGEPFLSQNKEPRGVGAGKETTIEKGTANREPANREPEIGFTGSRFSGSQEMVGYPETWEPQNVKPQNVKPKNAEPQKDLLPENREPRTCEPGTREPKKLRLSYTQKGFFMLQKMRPETSPNLVAQIAVRGALERDALQQALHFLVKRHPMLRTRFVSEGLNTFQEILPALAVAVDLQDLSHCSESERTAAAQAVTAAFQDRVFLLAEPPLFAVRVHQYSPAEAVFLLCLHHIIGDAWSLKALTNELVQVYAQIQRGEVAMLPDLQASFWDLVEQESAQENLSLVEVFNRERYWEQAFAGLPQENPVPTRYLATEPDRPVQWVIPAEQKRAVHTQCQAAGISLFTLLFTLYARALGRQLETHRVLISTSVSGRDLALPDIEKVIGCFARSLPINVVLSDSELKTNLKELERAFLFASENQDIAPRDLMRLYRKQGGASMQDLYRLFITYMDLSALEAAEPQPLQFDWEGAQFYFETEGIAADLLLGIRVGDTVQLSLNGRTNVAFRQAIQASMEADLDYFLPLREIDAALIAYLPSLDGLGEVLPFGKMDAAQAQAWIDKILPAQKPRLLEIEQTRFGRTGMVFLPYRADELSTLPRETLFQSIREAIVVAQQHGATHISLAGTLPSLTNYGFSVLEAKEGSALHLTTGHASTVFAVVKTVEKALQALDLQIETLSLGVVGFGSIGQATLTLLLSTLGHPAKILLADRAAQLPALQKSIAALQKQYVGSLEIVAVEGEMPAAFYAADLIIGASSSGQVLQVDQLRAGTILVDDSFPSILDNLQAIRRMQQQRDVLIIGGGKIDVGHKERTVLPTGLPDALVGKVVQKLGDEGLPGCRTESLLMSYDASLPGTIGLVQAPVAQQYWDRLNELSVTAVPLHLQGYLIPEDLLENVRQWWKR